MAANPQILSDLHEYVASKTGKPVVGGDKEKPKPAGPEPIPLPDFKDPASRLKYAKEYPKKYGKYFEERGDIPLRVDEKPFFASDTGKNLSVKFGNQYKIDPALLYSSAMEEGMSGIYPDAQNRAKWTGNKDYPVSAAWGFGLDSFQERFKDLQAKGYLPPGFESNFTIGKDQGFADPTTQAVLFKNTDVGLQAKAAMMKQSYDDIDAYAKKKGIPLSDKARDFFALASFNGGEGTGHQMLTDYSTNNLLKDEAYLKGRPVTGKGLKADSYKEVYDNVKRRLVYRDALMNEKRFDAPPPVVQANK